MSGQFLYHMQGVAGKQGCGFRAEAAIPERYRNEAGLQCHGNLLRAEIDKANSTFLLELREWAEM